MGQLLLFDSISYITPTPNEDEPDPRCPAYDPAPLGEDATRFGQLLDELKGNETAFYQGQMSTIALEYLETRDDDTVRDIINAVHGEKSKKKTPEEIEEFEKLWQARLLLKLAEIRRREEQEVHDSFKRIKDAQKDMFGDLKGEEEFQDLFNTLQQNLPEQSQGRVEPLIKAWGQLFTQGTESFTILNCFNPDAAEPFMEVSEAITGKRPARLMRLPLPNCAASPEDYLDKKERWQQKNSSWLAELKTGLNTVCQKGLDEIPLAEFSKMAAEWASQVEQTDLWSEHIPSPKYGPPALEIYLLGAGTQQLIAKLCNIKDKSKKEPHSLLAVVSSRPTTCS